MEQRTHLFLKFNAFSCLSVVSVFILIISSFNTFSEEAQGEGISFLQPLQQANSSRTRACLFLPKEDLWVSWDMMTKLLIS